MNTITSNIKRIREQKDYSQEGMAVNMGISQSKYSRIESGEASLSIKELQKIADILETDISAFLDNSKITIQNQSNNNEAYGYVENLHIENKETTKKLIQSLEDTIQQMKDEIQHLKNEVEFLRSMIKPDMPQQIVTSGAFGQPDST